jgi:hypothetical protein
VSYGRLCTEFYDLDKPAAPADALEFYARFAEREQGPIWEPMCGSGRFLVPLLERGFDIEGSDPSPWMLMACREHACKRGLRPVLWEQSLERSHLTRAYRLILIPEGSFSLIVDPAVARECLSRMHALLASGGTLVMEVEPLPSEATPASTWKGRWVDRPDGARLIFSWLDRYDPVQRITRSVHRYDLIQRGLPVESEFEEWSLRHYEPAEITELLESAGFASIRTRNGYGHHSSGDQEPRLIVECHRP